MVSECAKHERSHILQMCSEARWGVYHIVGGGGGGGFSAPMTGNRHVLGGDMNANVYQDILKSHMMPSAIQLIGRQYCFQHDNNPKDTARSTKEFLRCRKGKVLN